MKKYFIFIRSKCEHFSNLFLSSSTCHQRDLSLLFSLFSAVLQLCCSEQRGSQHSVPWSHAETQQQIPVADTYLSPILFCGKGKAVAFSLCKTLASEQSYKLGRLFLVLHNSAHLLYRHLCSIFPMRKDTYIRRYVGCTRSVYGERDRKSLKFFYSPGHILWTRMTCIP